MELKTRRVHFVGMTVSPDHVWMKQIARELTNFEDGFLFGKRYVIMDRDSKFGPRSTGVLLGAPVQKPIDLGRKGRLLIGRADRSQSDSLRHPGWIPEQFLDGEVDGVQLYDRALDASAISYL